MEQDLLTALRHIGSLDPDGRDGEPTEADYRIHRLWAIQCYGRQVWLTYVKGGWEVPSECAY